MKRATTIGLGVACLLFAILSARLGIPVLAYGVVATTILAVLLCVWGKLDKKWLPLLVFLLGLSFLYQTTLLSDNLIGTDIHTEYFVYQEAVNDGWDTTYPHAYNTAIGSTIIAPALTNYLGIPGYFIYKVIFPFLFAFVPLILFYLYRHEFTDKVAFLACVIFITLPTYTLEMIGLPRQMLGELMLAIGMLLVVMRPMRMRYLIPALIVILTLGYLFHYVIGAVILAMFVGCFLVGIGMRSLGRWVSFPRIEFPLRWLTLIVVLPAVVGVLYFSNVAGGVVADSLSNSVVATASRTISAIDPHEPDTTAVVILDDSLGYFERQEPLIRTALGLDFAEASPTGKGFRIFQFGIQFSLIAGCVWLWFNRRKVSAEYIWFAAVAIVLLAAVIFLPRFSNVINATRFYHIALFALSPIIVKGAIILFRRFWVAVLILIVPYLLFATGAMFEVMGEEDIGKINLPYSIALSNYRIGAVSEYTANDKIVADWIVDNSIEPVLTDIGGMLLLSQRKEPFEYISRSQRTGKYYTVRPPGMVDIEGMSISELDRGWGYLPQDVSELPDGVYIFLTERSIQTGTVTFKPQWYAMTDSASGMRVNYPFDFLGLQEVSHEVFRSGDAVVLVTGEDWDGTMWRMATSWDPGGHSQGAETDGTYVWWSSGNRLTKTYVGAEDWYNPIAENTDPQEDGTYTHQINGISLGPDDGYIYASAPLFNGQPYRFFVKWFDEDTLVFVGEQELYWSSGGDLQEGLAYYDSRWFAVKFSDATVDIYASDWSLDASAELPGQPLEIQGADWVNDQFWVTTTSGPIRVYDWNGTSFTLATTLTHPGDVINGQSFGIAPDGTFMYMADFSDSYEYLHKINISWEAVVLKTGADK